MRTISSHREIAEDEESPEDPELWFSVTRQTTSLGLNDLTSKMRDQLFQIVFQWTPMSTMC